MFLVRILTRSPVVELAERIPEHLALQQSSTPAIDDLVLTAPETGDQPAARLAIAVRRAPGFTRGEKTTTELVQDLARSELGVERDTKQRVERRFAVAVCGHRSDAQAVAELSDRARQHRSPQRFFEHIDTAGMSVSRELLGALQQLIAAALQRREMAVGGSLEHRCWSFLVRLRVIDAKLEPGTDGAWAALVDELQPVTADRSRASAIGLRDRLEQLSAELVSRDGEINRATLRKRLHGGIGAEPRSADRAHFLQGRE